MRDDGMDRRRFLALGAGALGLAVTPGWLVSRERLVHLTVPVMGTLAEFAVPARHEATVRPALSAAAAELRRIEILMTRFRATSDVGRFNSAAMGSTVPVAPETAEVVRGALAWARLSEGAFDPTLEEFAVLWDPSTVREPPQEERIQAAKGGGWRELEVVESAGGGVLRRVPGSALDLGGIAKGYAVDQAARILRGAGVFRGVVNVGGDLMVLGDGPGGRPWRVGIRDPRKRDAVLETVEVTDAAVATSGDYLRYFTHRGRRYPHLLDPRTGRPVQGALRTVTVVAESVATADAAATLAFVRGQGPGGTLPAPDGSEVHILHSG